jgi:hypothetical protein
MPIEISLIGCSGNGLEDLGLCNMDVAVDFRQQSADSKQEDIGSWIWMWSVGDISFHVLATSGHLGLYSTGSQEIM